MPNRIIDPEIATNKHHRTPWKDIMRLKLLFFSLFLGRSKAGDGLGQRNYTYSENFKKEMDEKLAKYNATFPPILLSSELLQTDTFSQQQEINGTTRDILTTLQNPEIFARHVVSSQKTACDPKKSFVGPTVIVNSMNEMTLQNTTFAGAYLYAPSSIDTILLAPVSVIGNPTQTTTKAHEDEHRFWHVNNEVQCSRLKKSNKDTKLTLNEQLSAPYNSKNKPDFIEAINEAKQNLAQLREDITLLQATPTVPDLNLKKRLDCYEVEAKQFAIDYELSIQSALPALLDKLFEEMDATEEVYSQSDVWYELSAVINARLSFFPQLFNDCCPKLRAWYSNTVPKYAKIVEEIDPNRFALTCKRNS